MARSGSGPSSRGPGATPSAGIRPSAISRSTTSISAASRPIRTTGELSGMPLWSSGSPSSGRAPMHRSTVLPILILACSSAAAARALRLRHRAGQRHRRGRADRALARPAGGRRGGPLAVRPAAPHRVPVERRRHHPAHGDGRAHAPTGPPPRERGRRVTADFSKDKVEISVRDSAGQRDTAFATRGAITVPHVSMMYSVIELEIATALRAGGGERPRPDRQRPVPAVLPRPGRRAELHDAPGPGGAQGRGQGGAPARLALGHRRRDGGQRGPHAQLLGGAEHLQGFGHPGGDAPGRGLDRRPGWRPPSTPPASSSSASATPCAPPSARRPSRWTTAGRWPAGAPSWAT